MSPHNGVDFRKCHFNWHSKSVILLLGVSIGLTDVLRQCHAGYVIVERAQPLDVLLMSEPSGTLEPTFEVPADPDYGAPVEPTFELSNEPTNGEIHGEPNYVAYDQDFGRSSEPSDDRDSMYADFVESMQQVPAYEDYNLGLKPDVEVFNEPTLDLATPSDSQKVEKNIANDHFGKESNSGTLEAEVLDFENLPMVEQSAPDYLGTDKRVRANTDSTTFDFPPAPQADLRSQIENQQELEIESQLDSATENEIEKELEAEVENENKIEQEIEFERELKQEMDDRLERVLETKLQQELENEIENELEYEIDEQGINLNKEVYDYNLDQAPKPVVMVSQPMENYDYFSFQKPTFETIVSTEKDIERANDNLPANNNSPITPLEVDEDKSFEKTGKTDPSILKGQLEVPYLPYPRPSIEQAATMRDDDNDDDDDVDHVDGNSYNDDDEGDDADVAMDPSVANKRSAQVNSANRNLETGDVVFVGIVLVCTGSAVFGLVAAGLWWRKVHSDFKAAQPVEYGADVGAGGHLDEWEAPYFNYSKCIAPVPAVPGWVSNLGDKYKNWRTRRSSEGPPIILQTDGGDIRLCFDSQEDLAAEDEEDECPVYECPGLAETSNVEVSNPLFKSNSFDEGLSSGYMKLPSPIANDRRISAPTEMIKKELRNLK